MIGYYAHSHGSGHCNYANILGRMFGGELTVFTDRDYIFAKDVDVVKLENENPNGMEFDRNIFSEPRALHYAPINMRKITRRNRSILEGVIRRDIRLLIIDVSVEVAMLARVSSIPYAYVRLQGDRNDLPHLNAYEGASFLIAYFPKEMELSDTPKWVQRKTVYLGFVSKYTFEAVRTKRPSEYRPTGRPILLYIQGFGGNEPIYLENLHENFDIYLIGPESDCYEHSGIMHLGVVDCIRTFIEHADVVVASCGANMTSEILTLKKKFVAVPEIRPYVEQVSMAKSLQKAGWAVDFSSCKSLSEAVESLRDLEGILPRNSGQELLDFRDLLRSVAYRADIFVERYRSKSQGNGRGAYIKKMQLQNIIETV